MSERTIYFKSRKSLFFSMVVLCMFLGNSVLIYTLFANANPEKTQLIISILIIVPFAMLWFYFKTAYSLSPTTFTYQTGPIKGQIPIADIRSIKLNTTLWVGFKPATATKGIIIYYNTYDEIYISPKDNTAFKEALLSISPSITVL